MEESLCPCRRKVVSSNECIFCVSCYTWYHSSCVGLSDEEVIFLDDGDNRSHAPWFCPTCNIATPNSNLTQDSQLSRSSISKIPCPHCPPALKHKTYLGHRGLKLHISKKHKNKLPHELTQSTQSEDTSDDLAKEINLLKRTIKVLKRIPKGARHLAAIRLSGILDKCVEDNNIPAWKSLFTFAFTCLFIPVRDNKKKSLTTLVKSNINRNTGNQSKISKIVKTSLSRRVESKIAEGDIRGAVKILASKDSLAPVDEETLEKIKKKHPPPSKPMNFPPPPSDDETFLQITDKELRLAVSSFPNGSSSGIDGIRPQHLKDLIAKGNGEAGNRLVSSLTRFSNFILSGKINVDTIPVFYGANLCALRKKDGGIRPIAVGNTLRRLVAKLGCFSIRSDVGNYLRPTQLGFATKGGCEAAIHGTRLFMESNSDSDFVILKIDFENAFNSVNRDIMLQRVKEKIPQLYPFLWQAYYHASSLFFGNWNIPSSHAIQQGDPAGPALFCLILQPIIDKLISKLVTFYLDDGTLAGDPESVIKDFAFLISECKEVGLSINPSKCELFFNKGVDAEICEKFSALSPGIKIIDNISLLGAPVTNDLFSIFLNEKEEELKFLFERIKELKNSHIAFFLLRNCFAIPKLTYLLRTIPTWKFQNILSRFDNLIKDTLERITNTPLEPYQHTQASFPVSLGGLGIRKVVDISLPTFLSSIHSVSKLVNLMLLLPDSDEPEITYYGEGLLEWNKQTEDAGIPPAPFFQKNWDNLWVGHIKKSIPLLSDQEKAISLALERPESNTWLHALPSRSIGTLLDNSTFRIAIGLRLGSKICKPHTCVCGASVDPFGHHGLSCPKSAGRYSRHQELNNIICRALISAKIPCRLEPGGLCRDDGKRVDGMTLIPWKNGQSLVWDATCSDTLAGSHLPQTTKQGGSAAKNAASAKVRKYSSVLDQNFFFLPFAVETMGPWCEEALSFIDNLGTLLAIQSGEPRSRSFLSQRIGIAIQKGNAVSVMGTFPPSEPLSEVFYIL